MSAYPFTCQKVVAAGIPHRLEVAGSGVGFYQEDPRARIAVRSEPANLSRFPSGRGGKHTRQHLQESSPHYRIIGVHVYGVVTALMG